jgi:hypothetical protein
MLSSSLTIKSKGFNLTGEENIIGSISTLIPQELHTQSLVLTHTNKMDPPRENIGT